MSLAIVFFVKSTQLFIIGSVGSWENSHISIFEYEGKYRRYYVYKHARRPYTHADKHIMDSSASLTSERNSVRAAREQIKNYDFHEIRIDAWPDLTHYVSLSKKLYMVGTSFICTLLLNRLLFAQRFAVPTLTFTHAHSSHEYKYAETPMNLTHAKTRRTVFIIK